MSLSCSFNSLLDTFKLFPSSHRATGVRQWPIALFIAHSDPQNTSPLSCISINLLPHGLHCLWLLISSAPSANLVPMIHSVMRKAGREYWLTYSSMKSAAAAPLCDKSLINFPTSQSAAFKSCPGILSVWAGVTGKCCSVPSAVIHSENICADGAGDSCSEAQAVRGAGAAASK